MTSSYDPYAITWPDRWPGPWQGWQAGGGEYPSRQLVPLRGWVCSGCGRGWSPSVTMCGYCGQQEQVSAATDTVGVSARLGPGDQGDEDYER